MRLASKILVLLLIAAAMPTLAQPMRWYAGLSAGHSKTGNDLVTDRLRGLDANPEREIAFDSGDKAWKVFVGRDLTDNFGVELSYMDLGKSRLRATVFSPAGPGFTSRTDTTRHVRGVGLDAIAKAPLGPVEVFGRVGAVRASVDLEGSLMNRATTMGNASDVLQAKSRSSAWRYAIGADWQLGTRMAIRLEWERHSAIGERWGANSTGEAKMDAAYGGVVVHF